MAHATGLIHRDIKPSNVIAARRSGMDDVAKLLDFGLVLIRAESPKPHLAGEGQVFGTPQFMAPEQVMRGDRVVDERSDLSAMGGTLHIGLGKILTRLQPRVTACLVPPPIIVGTQVL